MNRLTLSNIDTENVVIVNAAPVSRALIVRGEAGVPEQVCWSSNTQVPDTDVKERQSARCLECKHNVRGAKARSCAYQQVIAVVKEDALEKVYRLKLPATSIFGKNINGMPIQEYVKYLAKNNTSVASIVTCIYKDTKSSWPRVLFKPVRSLTVEEVDTINEVSTQPKTIEAITLSVFGESATPSPFNKVKGYIHKNYTEV